MSERDFFTGIALLGLLIKEPLIDEVSGEMDPKWFAKAASKIANEVMNLKKGTYHEHKYQ